jgi:hypothetical protein
MVKQNSIPVALALSPKGTLIAIMLKDRTILVYNLSTGRLLTLINESIKEITRIQEEVGHERHAEEVLDDTEFQKKLAIEKEI